MLTSQGTLLTKRSAHKKVVTAIFFPAMVGKIELARIRLLPRTDSVISAAPQ